MGLWGALHKIGRFQNVPTVGTFINKLKLNLLTNIPTVGTFRKRPILCNAPQGTLRKSNLNLLVYMIVGAFQWGISWPLSEQQSKEEILRRRRAR